MKASVINFENKQISEIELPEEIFNVKWNPVLVQQVLLAQRANARSPWAHAKTRSEVRGGGRKPWRQKGTGRARHGSTRSPLWVGGGKAHGPSKDRDYSQKVNKKMRRAAIMSILSKKLKDGEIMFLESLVLAEPKTNLLAKQVRPLLDLKKGAKRLDVLMIPDMENKMFYRAASNLTKAKALSPDSLNVYDLLNYKKVVMDQKAVDAIKKHYAKK
jgi:large subunit ribosomal protein L4